MDNSKSPRTWLIEIRNEKGLTQHDVAKQGGFSRSYYAIVEAGMRTPSVSMAKKISALLDFEWMEFFEDNK